jgi:hypothetical protein
MVQVELREDRRGVPHLRDGFGRYKTPEVNGIKSHPQQLIDVSGLYFGGNEGFQALHGITWTFDNFDCTAHITLFEVNPHRSEVVEQKYN